MDQEQMNMNVDMEQTQESTPAYTPRPKWQIWAAWIGVVIVAAAFLLYLYQIATGGR